MRCTSKYLYFLFFSLWNYSCAHTNTPGFIFRFSGKHFWLRVCVCANWRCSVLSAQAHQQNIIIIFDITNNNVEYFAIYFRFIICDMRSMANARTHVDIYTKSYKCVFSQKRRDTTTLVLQNGYIVLTYLAWWRWKLFLQYYILHKNCKTFSRI